MCWVSKVFELHQIIDELILCSPSIFHFKSCESTCLFPILNRLHFLFKKSVYLIQGAILIFEFLTVCDFNCKTLAPLFFILVFVSRQRFPVDARKIEKQMYRNLPLLNPAKDFLLNLMMIKGFQISTLLFSQPLNVFFPFYIFSTQPRWLLLFHYSSVATVIKIWSKPRRWLLYYSEHLETSC